MAARPGAPPPPRDGLDPLNTDAELDRIEPPDWLDPEDFDGWRAATALAPSPEQQERNRELVDGMNAARAAADAAERDRRRALLSDCSWDDEGARRRPARSRIVLPSARRRGAGRPRARSGHTRSSARSGDSGSDDSGPSAPAVAPATPEARR
jgi:hypothetical protein